MPLPFQPARAIRAAPSRPPPGTARGGFHAWRDDFEMSRMTSAADGTFAVRCASEVAVAAGLTVKAGSWLRLWETDN